MDFVGVEREVARARRRKHAGRRYFPNCRLNFAENLLRHGNAGAALEDAEAIVSISEARDAKRWTFGRGRRTLALAASLRALGVGADDAVGLYASNVGESVVAMLGATATGATWTSCSPDFGARAVADRFGQVAPKALFVCDGFVSAGKRTCHAAKVAELAENLPSLEKIVVFDVAGGAADAGAWAASDKVAGLVESWDDFLASGDPAPTYDRVPFAHPQLVLYSSGTTGLPKSIAHGCGNALLQHAKELILHSDLKEGDKMLFYTTCGWMMWNWMASSLFAARRSCLPHARGAEGVDDLEDLRVVFSTGSPLMNEDFRYVYDKAGLGLDACAFDRENGARVVGEKAELACLSPFVAAPVKFFGDDEAKTAPRRCTDDDDGVWYHGDLVETTGSVGAAGGVVIHGRSDTTLKPGGVRIGTAEVYRFAEEHPAVDDSLVIGDQLKTGKRAGDVRIVLFVKLADGYVLDAALEKDVKAFIRWRWTPRRALLVAVDGSPTRRAARRSRSPCATSSRARSPRTSARSRTRPRSTSTARSRRRR
ncbi:synthetase [Aureococcus anophagefferens]|nr:synthetase [Aureococcus anophagefferens]